jgi:Na+/H+-translocating membrane pyrophosphatase
MGADLFGSFAESTCAALVISSNSLFANYGNTADGWIGFAMSIQNLMFPLTMIAFGIIICLITSAIGIFVNRVDVEKKIEATLKYQIIISTVLLAGGIYLAAHLSYPEYYGINESRSDGFLNLEIKKPYHAYLCALFGLVSGMIIGGFTEYMTSHTYGPVRELAGSCRTGAATNVIYGLALGYLSTIIPVICIALTAYGASTLLGYYGVALGALGMLSNLPISLAIDGYGPISDNAGGIAEMAEMGE